jgi:hypothetical protein
MSLRRTIALASLAVVLGGCTEVCPGDAMMRSMLADPDLCGSRSTAVSCQSVCPSNIEDQFEGFEAMLEVSSYVARKSPDGPIGRRSPGYWYLGVQPPSQLLYQLVPWHDGVPVSVPRAALRSSAKTLVHDETRMSAYFTLSDIRQGCILELAVVWAWTYKKLGYLLFAEDHESAVKVIGRRGTCPPTGRLVPDRGEAWKIAGQLWRTR